MLARLAARAKSQNAGESVEVGAHAAADGGQEDRRKSTSEGDGGDPQKSKPSATFEDVSDLSDAEGSPKKGSPEKGRTARGERRPTKRADRDSEGREAPVAQEAANGIGRSRVEMSDSNGGSRGGAPPWRRPGARRPRSGRSARRWHAQGGEGGRVGRRAARGRGTGAARRVARRRDVRRGPRGRRRRRDQGQVEEGEPRRGGPPEAEEDEEAHGRGGPVRCPEPRGLERAEGALLHVRVDQGAPRPRVQVRRLADGRLGLPPGAPRDDARAQVRAAAPAALPFRGPAARVERPRPRAGSR